MLTLGINAAFHDSAAALVHDGVVVAAVEEERFTRIKHAKRPLPFTAWELPYHAIDDVLRQAGATLAEVDHVAYSYDPAEFLGERHARRAATITLPLEPSAEPRGPWENAWDPLFVAYIVNAPRQLRDGAPLHLQKRLRAGRNPRWMGERNWHFVPHHLCHQASAFLAAPFDRCAVMTLDGRGERTTTGYGVYRDNRYRTLGEVRMPHSLGILYERVTAHLGFLHSSDEYKVMALAALGQPTLRERFQAIVQVGDDGRYTIAPFDETQAFGPARARGAPLEQPHLDLAASLQEALERAVLTLARWLRAASGERHLAMAGGVALNCVMNAKLRDAGIFERVWVQPAAGDAGTALGAALWIDARARNDVCTREEPSVMPREEPPVMPSERSDEASRRWHDRDPSLTLGMTGVGTLGMTDRTPGMTDLAPRRWTMTHAYLGPEYDDAEIEKLLHWAKLDYRRCTDIAAATAELLARNCIVGWFQGRMEFGPRALGARSILASPIDPQMQARLNELKDREDFRPVAPAIPEERLAEWFAPAEANDGTSPFMLFVYDVVPGQGDKIPSACHTDRTARVQTVSAATNPRFHALLEAFHARTGVPVVVNTSFNVRGEPIVGTPKAAIEAFGSTPLDALAIGPFLVEKRT